MKPLRNLLVGTALTVVGLVAFGVGDPYTTTGAEEHPAVGVVSVFIIIFGLAAIAVAILEWIVIFLMWASRSLRARLRRSTLRKPPTPRSSPPQTTQGDADIPAVGTIVARAETAPPAARENADALIAIDGAAGSDEAKRDTEPEPVASRTEQQEQQRNFNGASTTLQTFCHDLEDGSVSDAYALTSSQYEAATTAQAFKAKLLGTQANAASCTSAVSSASPTSAAGTLTVTAASDQPQTWTVDLDGDNGNMTITSIG